MNFERMKLASSGDYAAYHVAKFDENGIAVSFYAIDNFMSEEQYQNLLKNGAVVISEDDWQHYIGNYGEGENGTGYIRDPETGKPVSAPPYVPTAEEIAEAERGAAHSEITMETVEEALCAMDESIEEIKDALCEIDEILEGGKI